MRRKARGFRLDGSYDRPSADSAGDPDAFFFSGDGRHPAHTGHAFMAELAIYLMQQVTRRSHEHTVVYSTAIAAHFCLECLCTVMCTHINQTNVSGLLQALCAFESMSLMLRRYTISTFNSRADGLQAMSSGDLGAAIQRSMDSLSPSDSDISEPLFTGNKGDESAMCLLNESMRCVAPCL